MEDVLLSSLFAGVAALVLIETVLWPKEGEAARIPDEATEKSLKTRADRFDD